MDSPQPLAMVLTLALSLRQKKFYKAALAAGGRDEGAPGGRAEYSKPYYGCFVRDPDGHKVEAAFWDEQLE